ncbi:2,3-diaminopropionate biosynthesis protein SbnA [Bacillus cereus]|uniref:2,3-diaminopropionate biosynthesis protein SbnA n=1 Tax=Bacillus cereus TaxID=1396 RepID=UPI000279A9EB|nr:2,3-diaminopropionate biosynthesis protein SbnA [Bacillus cereus]EJR73563.1 2,3-diaminopropionate biosynthesis protein SbnA [Bacillus cereus VD166]MDA1913572.1 2,3-diaminopropionate biosynthesis protein SbnA [Bacillus cereus]MDA2659692.1 2,3-diaminopropionate biosynthesis protein SbnA [Bacillus cereus]MDZ4631608.1 2,3-diaminopropionate biosynthesis protein SbnA [Bacillus cereus]
MKKNRVSQSVLGLIGETPLILLESFSNKGVNVFAKLEGFNPGGSMKDRPAMNMIQNAEEKGLLKPGGRIIESSSGNLAISLSMIGALKGYKIHCVVDPRTSETNLKIMKAYGATIEMVTSPDPEGGYQKSRIKRVQELLSLYEGSFWPNQYDNEKNPESHYKGTAYEIYNVLQGNIDYLVIPVSSAGLLTGCGAFFKERIPNVKIIAVDAKGSTIFGGEPSPRKMTGIGGNITPPNLKIELVDEVTYVGDLEGINMCQELMANESLLVGPSSGAALFVANKIKQKNEGSKNIVVIFPDNGDRYLDGLLETLSSKKHKKISARDLIQV